MKKLFCLIVTITLLFANVIAVNALELKQGQTITIDTDYSVSITDNDPNDPSKTSTIHLYKSSYGHAYCEDANLEGPANGYKTYTINDILDEKKFGDILEPFGRIMMQEQKRFKEWQA